jgi:hypothetical protein
VGQDGGAVFTAVLPGCLEAPLPVNPAPGELVAVPSPRVVS